MQKILTIARREYQAMVATKAFVVGMAMMPILMLGGTWIPGLLKGMEKAETRKIAVVDGTGQLFEALNASAEQRNKMLTAPETDSTSEPKSVEGEADDKSTSPSKSLTRNQSEDRRARRAMGLEEIHRYALEQIPAEGFDDEDRLALSERIRQSDLYAFIEIPADILAAKPIDPTDPSTLLLPEVAYVAQDAALADAKRWAETSLNQLVKANRLAAAGVSPVVLLELERRASIKGTGLYSRDDEGHITSEEKPKDRKSVV